VVPGLGTPHRFIPKGDEKNNSSGLASILLDGGLFTKSAIQKRWNPIQRTNLLVHWNAPKHPWPKTLWVYHMVPTKFSPTVISNLMALGSFTEKDRTDSNTNGMILGMAKICQYPTPSVKSSIQGAKIIGRLIWPKTCLGQTDCFN